MLKQNERNNKILFFIFLRPDQKIEDTAETNAEILARLTSAVRSLHQSLN